MVPPVLAAKDPVLLPMELLLVDISDTELDFAVFITVLLDKDDTGSEFVNPLFDSEDPVLMLVDVIAVGNEDPETVSKEFAVDDPVLTLTDVLAANKVDPELVPPVLAAEVPVLLPM